jgi:DNA-binding response OmpR family regulator
VTESQTYKIIYIEDDEDMIDLVRLVLNDERFEVSGATDGKAGLKLMHQQIPDLVLLDLMLPDIGGWTIYQNMKENEILRDVPVIVITAQDAPIDRVLGETIAKVQVYITKPFSTNELRTAVKMVLNVDV